ncbi:DUF3014 domain-containing protein [Panacagrimonas sp.]|uniref:DUF3014 domain-containing protein n=1 Tax=Panacagrimonas sp. TaxID=2480088 RepID=UPI003B51984A
MNRSAWVGVVVGLAVLAGIYYYYFRPDTAPEPQWMPPPSADDDTVLPDPEEAASDPPIVHPMPDPLPEAGEIGEAGDDAAQGEVTAPSQGRLPELEASDEPAVATLRELFGAEPVETFLIPRDLIRRIVLTVDSLDREPLPLWLRPVRRVPGPLAAQTQGQGEEQTLYLADSNAARYAPLVDAFTAVDAQAFAAAYRRYYPLFQDAYDRIGNPRKRYFNDRLIEILDHLLATPAVPEPVALVRPKVLYLYADPALEERSSGQKLLLRLGRDHAAQVQAKLREIRSAILALSPQSAN